ncbi:MAG: S1C family serine protease [Oscillospiraceae bacterium]|nr:S1C family serine protease [Oscillospiraceae bacterium]
MPMYIALFLAFTLLVGGAGGAVGYYMSENGEPEPLQQQQPDNTDPANTGKTPDKTAVPAAALPSAQGGSALSIQEIFEFGDRSTVAISTMTDSVNVFGQPVSQASAGSGFVLTADGYILTNHHVIDGASDIAVLLYDGSEYPAEIIGGDMKTDIAVLKIDAEGLIPVQIGDSDSLKVGDQVVGIGNPLGELANSLTVGHLSAKKRIISIDDTPRQMLQIVASVSPGNSGGPLFNISGQVIGVVSAKTVADGVEGIGFAIPINLAADIANELIQNGKVTGRPLLGISYQELAVLDNADDYPKGVYVAQVNPGSAAETAGLKDGDVITAFEGERITSGSGLLIAKDLCRVGDTVTVTVWRSGQEIDLLVTFTEEAEEVTEQPTNQNPYFNPWGR